MSKKYFLGLVPLLTLLALNIYWVSWEIEENYDYRENCTECQYEFDSIVCAPETNLTLCTILNCTDACAIYSIPKTDGICVPYYCREKYNVGIPVVLLIICGILNIWYCILLGNIYFSRKPAFSPLI